jgi:hypothetical protein
MLTSYSFYTDFVKQHHAVEFAATAFDPLYLEWFFETSSGDLQLRSILIFLGPECLVKFEPVMDALAISKLFGLVWVGCGGLQSVPLSSTTRYQHRTKFETGADM